MHFRPCIVRLAGALALVAAAVPGAQAQVYKCADASGRVTYQQTPCGAAHRGGPVELFLDNGSGKAAPEVEARWRTAAQQRELVAGMPKRWVQQALGQPAEVRRGTPADAAAEVWIYPTPVATIRVGFVADAVVWSRREPLGAHPASADGTPVTADGPDAARSRVNADRGCDETLAELGPADNQQTVRVPSGAGGRMVDALRYTYEPVAGGLPVRLSFSCVDGLVANVSRDVPR